MDGHQLDGPLLLIVFGFDSVQGDDVVACCTGGELRRPSCALGQVRGYSARSVGVGGEQPELKMCFFLPAAKRALYMSMFGDPLSQTMAVALFMKPSITLAMCPLFSASPASTPHMIRACGWYLATKRAVSPVCETGERGGVRGECHGGVSTDALPCAAGYGARRCECVGRSAGSRVCHGPWRGPGSPWRRRRPPS